jgi:hypothetical protein
MAGGGAPCYETEERWGLEEEEGADRWAPPVGDREREGEVASAGGPAGYMGRARNWAAAGKEMREGRWAAGRG